MANVSQRPQLHHILKLRCPYCGKTRFLKPGSWFQFDTGCKPCDYSFEREVGYFAGASWMVNYTVAALSGCFVAAALLILAPTWNEMWIAALAALVVIVVGTLFTPFSMALWLYADHWLHPLNSQDQFGSKRGANL